MAASSSSVSLTLSAGSRTKQQSSSRMMKNSRRGRPYARDIHDLFATLISSLELKQHRQMFKVYNHSFTTDEAAENLSALKFSQSNRAPDPKEPSRVVTTTTTTTFSMSREMAKGICQHFMDARLIENASDVNSTTFKDRGIYVITPKGLHILERFITKNGINAEHLVPVFTSQPICMKLLHLERRTQDDELLVNRPVIEVIFKRFIGRQPNYPPIEGSESALNGNFDRTLGIEVQDITEKIKGGRGGLRIIKHTFTATSVLEWLCDFATICAKDEASEIAAHFVRLNLIELVMDRGRRDNEEAVVVSVEGDDGKGNTSRGEFRVHQKAIYGLTDWGRIIARWPGYVANHESNQLNNVGSNNLNLGKEGGYAGSIGGGEGNSPKTGPNGDDARSVQSYNDSASGSLISGMNGVHLNEGNGLKSPSTTSVPDEGLKNLKKIATAERLRTESFGGIYGNSGSEDHSTQQYNSKDSNTNRLKQILEEPALRSLFRDFLKGNFCEENLSFWLDVQDFKRRFHTTSSAVAVRSSAETSNGKGEVSGKGGSVVNVVRKLGAVAGGGGVGSGSKQSLNHQTPNSASSNSSLSAMERHQQDLIAMAFVIYNTYLAPASPCELNIEHNLRSELIGYMTKILHETKGPDGDLKGASEDRKVGANVNIPGAPLHASQLQTMVRLYERIQDHIFRLMATDSVPRFIKQPRFLNFVRSVQEYAEALESGQIDPRVNAGPGVTKSVVEAMDLNGVAPPSTTNYSRPERTARSYSIDQTERPDVPWEK